MWGVFRRYAWLECRDSACRRPFGVRRNAAGVCSEMTQRVDFCMGDTMSICQSIIATNRLYLTEHHTLRVILSGAAQQCNGERESRQMPRSRTPKGRQQAESRHSCKASYNRYQLKFPRRGTTHGSFPTTPTFLTGYVLRLPHSAGF